MLTFERKRWNIFYYISYILLHKSVQLVKNERLSQLSRKNPSFATVILSLIHMFSFEEMKKSSIDPLSN